MEITLIILLVIGIILMAASFFQRDKGRDIEQELDHLQLSSMQEIYKLKKKMRILEEELLQNDLGSQNSLSKELDGQIVRHILNKYKNGMNIEAISRAENVSPEEVRQIIQQNERMLV
ncbi:hypothetical protein GJU40_10810 [Bacillus lacus]|uniref:Uncharacterized protein n=1 Tax=Metabacillus lacus TaxID=1983721 RepID=A0A7X2M031_9BACI|nr:hypothetical protein [Metabacillus lacus]MRX72637.1 hypothetical protein [Metabacillus lacus]